MKGLKKVADASKSIVQGRDFMPLYYSIRDDKVMTLTYKSNHESQTMELEDDISSAYYVTDLIRPCTEDEIRAAVKRWLAM